jgi:hypothetical protein
MFNLITAKRSKLVFSDISDELSRTYRFAGGEEVVITRPTALNVSASGGHRVLDAAGDSHYIPTGWIHLTWTAKPGQPQFAF